MCDKMQGKEKNQTTKASNFSTLTTNPIIVKSLEKKTKEGNGKHLGLLIEAIEKKELMREVKEDSDDNDEMENINEIVAHKKLYNCKCKNGYSLTWNINESARIVGCATCMKAKLIILFKLKFNCLAKRRNKEELVQEHQFSLKFRKNSNTLRQIIETDDISAMLKTHVFQNFFSKYPQLIGKKMEMKRDKANITFQQKIAEFEHLLPFTYQELSKSKLTISSIQAKRISCLPNQDDFNTNELQRPESKYYLFC